jgi:DNA-binding transcriptional LysR family regulator
MGVRLVGGRRSRQYPDVDAPVELRQLRYFVAVAEELHFGRAAERVHMSQSPLSRAIRELERHLGVVLFVRTTRRVELTPAGAAFLEHARRALAEVDLAVDRARGAGERRRRAVAVGHGPLSRTAAARIAGELALPARLEEDLAPELLRRVAVGELTAAAVFATPRAAERHGVRIDALKDEPLLAALPAGHRYADGGAIPVGAFAAECVLLPREPVGRGFNAWLRAVILAAGAELDRTLETLSAPWDRRMLPVAEGAAVSVVVDDWSQELSTGVVVAPFDPPLTFPIDLASPASPAPEAALLVQAALRLRDAEAWLTDRAGRAAIESRPV